MEDVRMSTDGLAVFTQREIAYLMGQRIGRLATVAATGEPHVVPTGFDLDLEAGVIRIGAHDAPGRGQRRVYRSNIETDPRVAFVVDDFSFATSPRTPRGVSIRGHAAIHQTGGERLGPGNGPVWIAIRPTWVSSWGLSVGDLATERSVSRMPGRILSTPEMDDQ